VLGSWLTETQNSNACFIGLDREDMQDVTQRRKLYLST